MAMLKCPKCQKQIDSDSLSVYKCPDCKSWLDWEDYKEYKKTEPVTTQVTSDYSKLDENTKALVLAADRTTHAVRSLALFLFTTLITSLVGYGFIGAGSGASLRCTSYYSDCGSSGLIIFGWIVIALGFLFGLILGARELAKSNPD